MTRPPLPQRMEQKFFIRPDRMVLTLALLYRTCRRDPVHPIGQVNSLYFDSSDLDEHKRSEAGDSAKDKIRIRWYGEELDPHLRTPAGTARPTAAVWLELKSRRGFASTKQRLVVDAPVSALAFEALTRGIVPPRLLISTMAGFGFFPPRSGFCPVIAISYHRYRFVEPRTGFRVSFDSRIRSSLVMPGLGRGERGLELPGAVVEVKGPSFDVPAALRPLVEIGSSWTRYSKYSSSLDAHLTDLGTVSRCWPSGVMERRPGRISGIRNTTVRPAAGRRAPDALPELETE